MDKEQIQYAKRTMLHIRRVQDHMIYLIEYHAADMELKPGEARQLFENATRHDLSKWSTKQFDPYCDKFTRKINAPRFDAAWANHYVNENHHYQNGAWMGKLETVEVCCDLQAMADEFGEGSAFGFWDKTWRPKFHEWLNGGMSTGTMIRRQMADDYHWHTTMAVMEQVIGWLAQRGGKG